MSRGMLFIPGFDSRGNDEKSVTLRKDRGTEMLLAPDVYTYPAKAIGTLEQILATGGSGADEDMIRGNTLAVVVANRHEEELSALVDADRVFPRRLLRCMAQQKTSSPGGPGHFALRPWLHGLA